LEGIALLLSLTTVQKCRKQERHEASPIHFAFEDKTGDSATIEVIDGKVNIYHSPEYLTMTNSPPYAQQLQLQFS